MPKAKNVPITCSRPENLPAFIEAVLAPLPEREEPVESKAFTRQVRQDVKTRWHVACMMLDEARDTRSMYSAMLARSLSLGQKKEVERLRPLQDAAFLQVCRAVDYLIRTPAPHHAGIAEKRSYLRVGGGNPEWQSFIDADLRRLPPPKPRGRRLKAGEHSPAE